MVVMERSCSIPLQRFSRDTAEHGTDVRGNPRQRGDGELRANGSLYGVQPTVDQRPKLVIGESSVFNCLVWLTMLSNYRMIDPQTK